MSAAPVRAYALTLSLDADTRDDLVRALINLAHRIDRDEATSGVWGGSSDGAIYDLKVNPEMTHDRYVEQLHAYLATRKAAA